MLRELKTFMMFYKVGYEDVLLVVCNGENTNALEVVIKITSTSLQHCNPQFKSKIP
jgi:hypothetical protein